MKRFIEACVVCAITFALLIFVLIVAIVIPNEPRNPTLFGD